MPPADSALDPQLLARVRALLTPPARREPAWPAVAAALFAVTCALLLAMSLVAPPPAEPAPSREVARLRPAAP